MANQNRVKLPIFGVFADLLLLYTSFLPLYQNVSSPGNYPPSWCYKTFQVSYFKVGIKYITRLTRKQEMRSSILQTLPHDWNSPCGGEGASHQEVSTRVRQQEELNWASQLKSSDQQIFSTMSGTDSPLIR